MDGISSYSRENRLKPFHKIYHINSKACNSLSILYVLPHALRNVLRTQTCWMMLCIVLPYSIFFTFIGYYDVLSRDKSCTTKILMYLHK